MKVISKFLIFSFSFSIVTSIYPIAVFHGIVDSCEMTNTSMLVNDLKRDLGVHVECIEVGNGYMDSVFMPFTKQAGYREDKLKREQNRPGDH